jgi:hypothetical protein
MGKHNRSENGRGVWVALCAHHTHTDTDTANSGCVYNMLPDKSLMSSYNDMDQTTIRILHQQQMPGGVKSRKHSFKTKTDEYTPNCIKN